MSPAGLALCLPCHSRMARWEYRSKAGIRTSRLRCRRVLCPLADDCVSLSGLWCRCLPWCEYSAGGTGVDTCALGLWVYQVQHRHTANGWLWKSQLRNPSIRTLLEFQLRMASHWFLLLQFLSLRLSLNGQLLVWKFDGDLIDFFGGGSESLVMNLMSRSCCWRFLWSWFRSTGQTSLGRSGHRRNELRSRPSRKEWSAFTNFSDFFLDCRGFTAY